MTMKLQALEAILNQSKDQLDTAQKNIFISQMKAQAAVEAAQIDADIYAKEGAINTLLTAKTIKFADLIKEMDTIAVLERRRAQYASIQADLFPTGKASVAKKAVKTVKKVAKKTK